MSDGLGPAYSSRHALRGLIFSCAFPTYFTRIIDRMASAAGVRSGIIQSRTGGALTRDAPRKKEEECLPRGVFQGRSPVVEGTDPRPVLWELAAWVGWGGKRFSDLFILS